jgi:hypothetical protein
MREPDVFAHYAETVRTLPGVLDVSTNGKCGSMVIRYDPKATTSRALLEKVNGNGATMPRNGRAVTAAQTDGTVQQAAQAFGMAVGQALFNAVFRFGVERSVTTLLRRR